MKNSNEAHCKLGTDKVMDRGLFEVVAIENKTEPFHNLFKVVDWEILLPQWLRDSVTDEAP